MIDWSRVQTVLLDMDGTLLDLNFDNRVWNHLLPTRLAEMRGISPQAAHELFRSEMSRVRGSLNWYCLDYWSELFDICLHELESELLHLVQVHPHSHKLFDELAERALTTVLVTNAHRASLDRKLARTGIANHFNKVICAHELGYPKESLDFWRALATRMSFDPALTLLVDDNLQVLRTAQEFGIAQVLAAAKPDSQRPAMDVAEFPSVADYNDLFH